MAAASITFVPSASTSSYTTNSNKRTRFVRRDLTTSHATPLSMAFRSVAALILRDVPFRKGVRSSSGGGKTPEWEEDERGNSGGHGIDDDEEERMAEELELLEEEAITAESEGKEPRDYDRRAHLFDESSRIFSDLKEKAEHRHHHTEDSP